MAPPQKIEGSWEIDPVLVRLRVLGGLDTGLLWGNLGVISFGVASAVAHFSRRAVALGEGT